MNLNWIKLLQLTAFVLAFGHLGNMTFANEEINVDDAGKLDPYARDVASGEAAPDGEAVAEEQASGEAEPEGTGQPGN